MAFFQQVLRWLSAAKAELFRPWPGSQAHKELTMRLRREWNRELAKPLEERDEGRLVEVYRAMLRAEAEEAGVGPRERPTSRGAPTFCHSAGPPVPTTGFHRQPPWHNYILYLFLQISAQILQISAESWDYTTVNHCVGCPGSDVVRRRLAASCAARAAWCLGKQAEALEMLRALEEGDMDGAHRLWHASTATFDLPEDDEAVAAMRAVPPTDVCSACHKALETVSTTHAAFCCVAVACG
jgi:hypothetical protein